MISVVIKIAEITYSPPPTYYNSAHNMELLTWIYDYTVDIYNIKEQTQERRQSVEVKYLYQRSVKL